MSLPVRAAAIVINGEHVALIARTETDGRLYYEVPGGGVEPGESLEEACLRELWEETGLRGAISRKLAIVSRRGRKQHYFLVETDGRAFATSQGPEYTELTLMGRTFEPEWLPVEDLRSIPVWPAKLCRLVPDWHAAGSWPEVPVELADDALALAGEY